MANKTDVKTEPTFLTLLLELRLKIYEHAKSPCLAPCWTAPGRLINNFTKIKVDTQYTDLTTLATLSRTNMQVHNEIGDVLYHKAHCFVIMFGKVDYVGLFSRVKNADGSRYIDTSFIKCMKRARMQVNLPNDGHNFMEQVTLIGQLLDLLSDSAELRIFTFELYGVRAGGEAHDGMEEKVAESRRLSTKEVVKAGRNAKERELDYAKRVVDLLKTHFDPEQ